MKYWSNTFIQAYCATFSPTSGGNRSNGSKYRPMEPSLLFYQSGVFITPATIVHPQNASSRVPPPPCLSLTHERMLGKRVCRWVEQDTALRMPCSGSRSKTHLVMVGVEAAHQLPTIRLLLLLKLAEGRREGEKEEEEEGRGGPAPHGRERGERCARGEGGSSTALQRTGLTGPNPHLPLSLTYNTPLLVCMRLGTGL